jgi:hypothetical protein
MKLASARFKIGNLIVLAVSLCALAVFLWYFATLLIYARSLINFPLDYDQGEGFELYDAIRLRRGQSIYLDNSAYPFYSSNYPPVYRLMLVPMVWLFGGQIWVGRALTFACTLIIGGLIWLAIFKDFKLLIINKSNTLLVLALAFLPPLAFFAANYVYHIAPLARAHMPMVMFALAGAMCLERAFHQPRTGGKWFAWGIVLLIVAGFTKLQAIDALAAGFAYALIQHWRWGVKALAISAVVTGGVVLVLNALTQGQFWFNVVAANVNEYDIQQTWRIYAEWFRLQAPLILCAVAHVAHDLAQVIRARSVRTISIWSYYFITGSAMGMLTGKWGAGPAYLIAAIAVSCICAGRLFVKLIGNERHSNTVKHQFSMVMFAFIFLWQAGLNLHLPTSGRLYGPIAQALGVARKSSYEPYAYYDSIGYTQLGHLVSNEDLLASQHIIMLAKSVNRPIWSEEAMISLMSGKDVVTNPTQLYNIDKNNQLDTAEMIRMINEKHFGLVVLRAFFYPPDVLEAIGKNYDRQYPATRMNGFDYWFFTPKL